MIEKHIERFKELMPTVKIKAAFTGRDEASGDVAFCYYEPSKLLFVVDENDELYVMFFTAFSYAMPIHQPGARLKKSISFNKNISINLSNANINPRGQKMPLLEVTEDDDDLDAIPKKRLFASKKTKEVKPRKILYNSNYILDETMLGSAFESDTALLTFLFATFNKERAKKAGKPVAKKANSFDF